MALTRGKAGDAELTRGLDCLVAQMVKNLPAMWETWVRSLGWEDPLKKELATHSNILAWEIPWTEEPSGLQSTGLQSQTRLTHTHQTAWILFLDPLLDLDLGSSVSENTLLSGVHSVFCICFLSPPPHFSLGG